MCYNIISRPFPSFSMLQAAYNIEICCEWAWDNLLYVYHIPGTTVLWVRLASSRQQRRYHWHQIRARQSTWGRHVLEREAASGNCLLFHLHYPSQGYTFWRISWGILRGVGDHRGETVSSYDRRGCRCLNLSWHRQEVGPQQLSSLQHWRVTVDMHGWVVVTLRYPTD